MRSSPLASKRSLALSRSTTVQVQHHAVLAAAEADEPRAGILQIQLPERVFDLLVR